MNKVTVCKRMTRQWRVAGVICAIACGLSAVRNEAAAPAGVAGKTEPYAFRGVRLGIALDDFRAAPIPAFEDRIDLHVVCTGDPLEATERVSGYVSSDLAIGVKVCQWFSKRGSLAWAGPDEHWVEIGEGGIWPTFFFIPDGGTYRLYAVRGFANSQYHSGIRGALSAGYGVPKQSSRPFTTKAGVTVPSVSLSWPNGVSSILLTEPCVRLERFCLSYTHTRLIKVYEAAVARRASDAATKI